MSSVAAWLEEDEEPTASNAEALPSASIEVTSEEFIRILDELEAASIDDEGDDEDAANAEPNADGV